MTWWITTALANAVVVGALAPPVHLASRALGRPALTHALWLLLLVKLLTPPLVRLPLPWELELVAPGVAAWLLDPRATYKSRSSERSAGLAGESAGAAEGVSGFAGSAGHPRATAGQRPSLGVRIVEWCHALNGRDLLRGLLALWIVGGAMLAGGVARNAWRFSRRLPFKRPISPPLQAAVDRLALELRLGCNPPAVFTDRLVSPMLWGVGPWVWLVFPRELWNRISDEQRRALLLHELGHFVRRDPWVRLIEVVASIVFWWHPVVWWARREIERSSEECCDALVLDWEDSPRNYAEAIIITLGFLAGRSVKLPAPACGVSPVPALKQRLAQIMRREVSPRLPAAARRVVLAASLVVVLFHPFLPLGASRRASSTAAPSRVAAPVARTAIDLEKPLSPKLISAADPFLPKKPNSAAPAATNSFLPSSPHNAVRPDTERQFAQSVSPNLRWRLTTQPGRAVTLESLTDSTRTVLNDAAITAVAWLPSGDRFVTGSRTGRVQLWDAVRGAAIATLRAAGDEIRSIAVDPTGRTVVAGSAAGGVLQWDLGTGAATGVWESPSPGEVLCVRWSPRRAEIAVTLRDGRSPPSSRIVLLDSERLEVLALLSAPGDLVVCGFDAFDRVYAADSRGPVFVWDYEFQVLVPLGTASPAQLAAAAFSPQSTLWPGS